MTYYNVDTTLGAQDIKSPMIFGLKELTIKGEKEFEHNAICVKRQSGLSMLLHWSTEEESSS